VHRGAELGAWSGTLAIFEPVRVVSHSGLGVDSRETKVGQATQTQVGLDFAGRTDAQLVLVPGGQGMPLEFHFAGDLRADQIFVGIGRVSPKSTAFALAMQDRHGMAWADVNGDGQSDVFVSRGALSGTLRRLPEAAARGIRDELLVSRGPGRFEDVTAEMGIEKKGCSGRHVNWVDVDGDDVLELFVNCYDRENLAGDYPKQLYRRNAAGRFEDLAGVFGLGLPHDQIGSYAWFDVDGDGKVDLLAVQDDAVVLYRNNRGHFIKEVVARREGAAKEKIGRSTESAVLFDGKVVVADFDRDGRFDAFISSKRGNMLLRNASGRLVPADLARAGLPSKSLMASWVDFDNDGHMDLHFVPQGMYRQRPDHTFVATGQLEQDAKEYKAAVVNWADFDNDGRPDVVLALARDRDFSPWWQFGGSKARTGDWYLAALRNVGAEGHWLQVDLRGPSGNREGIGAVLTVKAGDVTLLQVVGASEGSFFSQGHYRSHFGLGSWSGPVDVSIRTSSGASWKFPAVQADRLHVFQVF
jgi:hypothetical protein